MGDYETPIYGEKNYSEEAVEARRDRCDKELRYAANILEDGVEFGPIMQEITVCHGRYGYAGYWLAYPGNANDNSDHYGPWGGDMDAMVWHDRNDDLIGRGDTPLEALSDLMVRVEKAGGSFDVAEKEPPTD